MSTSDGAMQSLDGFGQTRTLSLPQQVHTLDVYGSLMLSYTVLFENDAACAIAEKDTSLIASTVVGHSIE